MTALDRATEALVRVALAIPDAPSPELEARVRAAAAAGTPAVWLEELILAAVLFVGFPRALVAARVLRAAVPASGDGADAADYARWREWVARGEETCRKIYGAQYDKLRRNVAALHPALDAWIVVDGYGRTLSRPGLDLPRRELLSIAMLVAQDVPRQMHSHLRGALNVGASRESVEAVLQMAETDPAVPGSRALVARRRWQELAALPAPG